MCFAHTVLEDAFVFTFNFSPQDGLCQQGVMTDGQKDQILKEQRALEERMRAKMAARKQQQIDAHRIRLAIRRKKKMEQMKERHEREKHKVK